MKPFRVLRIWPTIVLATAVLSCTDERKITEPSIDVAPQMVVAAAQAPVANPGGPYTGFAKTDIQFDGRASFDPDSTPLTYAWTFGDGKNGKGATPKHAYASSGTYTLTLTVKDKSGAVSEPVSTTVTVLAANQAPVAVPGGPYTGHPGIPVQLDGSASTDPEGHVPLTYRWNFGDKTTLTGPEARPTHTYKKVGTFRVTLRVTDSYGQASPDVTTTVTITPEPANQQPVANAGGSYSAEAGTALAFDGSASADPEGEALTYAWTFGDGNTGTGVTPSHTYAQKGTYTVTLTVTDARGLSSAPDTTSADIWSNVLIGDSFSRVFSDGWGTPDIGGPWRVDPLRLASTFRVDGSRAVIELSDTEARKTVGGGLETYGLDVDGLTSISVDRFADAPGEFHTVQVYARRNDRDSDGNNHYRYRLRIFGNGTMDVRIEKQVAGVATWLTTNMPTGVTFTPGAKYWIRWEAVGTSPATTVRMRVWADGTLEPTVWHASATIDEPALDLSGTTGVRFWAPETEQVNWPIRLYVDDFRYSLKN